MIASWPLTYPFYNWSLWSQTQHTRPRVALIEAVCAETSCKAVADAPEPEMWSADEKRLPVQIAGDEERPLPDARRTVTGRADGK